MGILLTFDPWNQIPLRWRRHQWWKKKTKKKHLNDENMICFASVTNCKRNMETLWRRENKTFPQCLRINSETVKLVNVSKLRHVWSRDLGRKNDASNTTWCHYLITWRGFQISGFLLWKVMLLAPPDGWHTNHRVDGLWLWDGRWD